MSVLGSASNIISPINDVYNLSSPQSFSPSYKRQLCGPSQVIELLHPLQPLDNEFELKDNTPLSSKRYNLSRSGSSSKEFKIFSFDKFIQIQSPQGDRNRSPKKPSIMSIKKSNLMHMLRMRQLALQFFKSTVKKAQLFKFLSPIQIHQIEKILNLNMMQDVQKKLELDMIPVFGIQSQITLIWDIFQMFALLITFLWYPYYVSFESIEKSYSNWIQFGIIFILIGDMIMNFNRAQIKRGNVIKERRQIFRLYLEQDFMTDIFSFLCVLLKFTVESKWVSIILTVFYILSKSAKAITIQENLIDYYNIKGYFRDFISLIGMLVTAFYIVHFIACIWHGVAFFSHNQANWLKYYGLFDADQLYRYIVSFYWAAMTMTTVGYGDITPKNTAEYFVADCTMLFSCIFFGYTMNRVGLLINSLNQKHQEFKQKIATLNSYMTKHKIDFELQSRVRSYLDYMWQAENEDNVEDISSIVANLSTSLQDELQYEVKGKLLKKCQIFSQFSPEFVKKASQIIQQVRFAPEEIIINDFDNALYILQQGDIKIKPRDVNLNFKAHNIIGERTFFTNQQEKSIAVSSGFSTLLRVSRSKFLELLNFFSFDKEIFHQRKDKMIFDVSNIQFVEKCPCCSSNNHPLESCNLVLLNLDRERIIKQFNFPHVNQRVKIQRRILNRHQTLKLVDYTQQSLKLLIQKMSAEEAQKSSFDHPSLSIPLNDEYSINQEFSITQHSLANNLKVKTENMEDINPDWTKDANHSQLSLKRINSSKTNTFQTAGFNSGQELSTIAIAQMRVAPMVKINEDVENSSSEDSRQSRRSGKSGKSGKSLKAPLDQKESNFVQKSIQRIDSYNLQFSKSLSQSQFNKNLGSYKTQLKSITSHSRNSKSLKNSFNKAPTIQAYDEMRGTVISNKSQGFSLNEAQNQYFLTGFEKMQLYQYYFPDGNYDVMIKKYEINIKLSKQFFQICQKGILQIYLECENNKNDKKHQTESCGRGRIDQKNLTIKLFLHINQKTIEQRIPKPTGSKGLNAINF